MDFPRLKTLITGQTDPLAYMRALVDVDAGLIPRRSLKLVILGQPDGNSKLTAVIAAIPHFATDPDFSTIRISDPLTQAVFAGLVTAQILTADDVAALNALGTVQAPRWQAEGFEREPDFADVDKANSLP